MTKTEMPREINRPRKSKLPRRKSARAPSDLVPIRSDILADDRRQAKIFAIREGMTSDAAYSYLIHYAIEQLIADGTLSRIERAELPTEGGN